MKAAHSVRRKTSVWFRILYYLVVAFCFVGCNEKTKLLRTFSKLEKEALKYGTVSVGAVRVTDYNDTHLKDARKHLRTALTNLRYELGGSQCKRPERRPLSAAAGIVNPSSESSDDADKPLEAIKGQLPQLSEIELVGLRMAALKFVESELEDVNLFRISRVEHGFRRVEVSLDCSAWVRGPARAALVYIDLYPYKVDCWCHEAAKIMEEWWTQLQEAKENGKGLTQKQEDDYQKKWQELIDKELVNETSGNAFKALDNEIKKKPDEPEIEAQRDPEDWVAFCHRWLAKKDLFPHIVHVERMGKTEYLILADSDYSALKFDIGVQHPAGPSATWGVESGKKAGRLTTDVRPLSLAFVAGYLRAGWLFMPSQKGTGRMPPTERRLRMVVDIPKDLVKLGIHIHKLFLGPDLEVLQGAAFSKQVKNLDRARDMLTDADVFYEDYQKDEPRHYRLIKTRMRNLLYQGWAEEIPVDIPSKQSNGLPTAL